MSEAVLEMGQINIRGNIIDHGWYRHLVKENGKPYLLAANILAEIVFWYKPVETKDEVTNQVTYHKKFSADKLQKSYEQLGAIFGVTKRQVKEACDFLKNKNLITVEFRTIEVEGLILNNVMYVEVVPEEIKKISSLYETDVPHVTKKCNRVVRKNVGGYTQKRKTNTDITSEILSSSSKSTCEESGGVPSTVPSGGLANVKADAGEIPHTSREREDAKILIENKYIQLRGNGFALTPLDEAEIDLILDEGVHVNDALIWLEQCFTEYEPRHKKDRIRSLSYCTPKILDKHYNKCEAMKARKNNKKGPNVSKRPGNWEGLNFDD